MAHADPAHAEAHTHAGPTSFIWKYVFSKDHKVIGIQYYVTAMLMALVAGTLAMLIRLQLAWPENAWPLLTSVLPSGEGDDVAAAAGAPGGSVQVVQSSSSAPAAPVPAPTTQSS